MFASRQTYLSQERCARLGAGQTVLATLALVFLVACVRHDPQAAYDRAFQTFKAGDAVLAAQQAGDYYRDFHRNGPEWAWKFTILKARALYRQGKYEDVLALLASEPSPVPSAEMEVRKRWIEGLAYTALNRLDKAEATLLQTDPLCQGDRFPICGDVTSAQGTLEMHRGRFREAQLLFERVRRLAREKNDHGWEIDALLDLSWSAEEQTHFDEALDWAAAARSMAISEGLGRVAQAALGNMGWAYYKLGDAEKAREMFIEAGTQAEKLGDITDQEKWLGNLGYVQMDAGDLPSAEQSFQRQLKLAQQIHSPDDILDALIGLAFVCEKSGKLDESKRYADDALVKARADHNAGDEAELRLVEGRVAIDRHDNPAAEAAFRQVAASAEAVDLKWEAERSLARLFEDENQSGAAELEYRTALTTFETARCSHQRIDSRLPFLSNAARIYEDYIHFLVTRGRTNEALQVADYTRARTLAEGLGRPCKAGFAPDRLNATEIARRADGAVLFYALGKEHSYVWAITLHAAKMFPLASNEGEIDAAVQRYRDKLEGPPAILEASDDGNALYKMLVAPAQEFLKRELRIGDTVFIVADSSLNNLNFETLIPDSRTDVPKRYWIEDVTAINAPSLRLLPGSRHGGGKLEGNLLLLGDPAAPDAGSGNLYPPLPNAAVQMQNITKYFPDERQKVFAHAQAPPSAYLNNHPEKFSYIHFVAHGTASRTSPLDSAIILSPESDSGRAGRDDSFKLYARDVIATPRLKAQVVTVSACYSSGKRTYSGEGLVGLSWAFLRAGAHNVVAALWDVSDASAPQIMDAFYHELNGGKSPGSALRTAKLSLLHTQEFHSPFYWAAFQLYAGQ